MKEQIHVSRAAGIYFVYCSREASEVIADLDCVNSVYGPVGKSMYEVHRDLRYSHEDFMAALSALFADQTDQV